MSVSTPTPKKDVIIPTYWKAEGRQIWYQGGTVGATATVLRQLTTLTRATSWGDGRGIRRSPHTRITWGDHRGESPKSDGNGGS